MSPSLSLVWSKHLATLALVPFLLLGCKDAAKEEPAAAAKTEDPAAVHPEIWPTPKWPFARDEALEEKVATLLKKMTAEEKVGQVIQGDIASMTPEDMKKYHLGSILAGGGSAPGGNERAPVLLFSTSNIKRARFASATGTLAITPMTSISRCSNASGSAWARRSSARQAAQP